MVCQNCGFQYASTLGCQSCGWKFDPDYHPVIGQTPTDSAQWILAQSQTTLEKAYGVVGAQLKIQAAKAFVDQMKPATPPPSPVKESFVTATVKPVASPFSAPTVGTVEETIAEPVDYRKIAKEAKAPAKG